MALMNKICGNSDCTNRIKPTGKRFCSLDCANKVNNSKKLGSGKLVVKNCLQCSAEFSILAKYKRKKFCDRSCAAKFNNARRSTTTAKFCTRCQNQLNVRAKTNYCSVECRQEHEIELWLVGKKDGSGKYFPRAFVGRWLLRRSGGRCEGIDSRTGVRCVEDRIVELDHIDGNWENNTPQNIRHLCPTCHALTDTYGAKNKGKGRTWKKEYSQFRPKSQFASMV